MYRTGLLVAGRIPGSNITRRLFSGAGLSDNWQGHGQHWAWGGRAKYLRRHVWDVGASELRDSGDGTRGIIHE
jgi:hypothetical protein